MNEKSNNRRNRKPAAKPVVYDKPDQKMVIRVARFGKKGRTAEIVVILFGKSYTRHVRLEGRGWMGWNPSHTAIIRYYAVDSL